MKTGVVLAATVLGVVTGCGPHEVNIGGTGGAADDTGRGGTYPMGTAGTLSGLAGGFATGGSGPAGSGDDPVGRAGYGASLATGGSAGSAYGVAGAGGTYEATGGYPTDVAGEGNYGTGGYGYAGEPTGVAGYGYGGSGGNPSGSSGGSGGYGYAGGGGLVCASDTIFASDRCEDDDVLLGRAYQVCVSEGLALASVTFLYRCSGDSTSGALDLTCCASGPASATGGAGSGGSGRQP